jgi:hypothetical protein
MQTQRSRTIEASTIASLKQRHEQKKTDVNKKIPIGAPSFPTGGSKLQRAASQSWLSVLFVRLFVWLKSLLFVWFPMYDYIIRLKSYESVRECCDSLCD